MSKPKVRRFARRGWSATDGQLAAFGSTEEEAVKRFHELADRDAAEEAQPEPLGPCAEAVSEDIPERRGSI